MFTDDGSVPNNPQLPFLIYRRAVDLIGSPAPARIVGKAFRRNGWGDTCMLPRAYCHSMIHEGTGITRGRVKVHFGGSKGKEAELAQGNVLCRGSKGEHAKALETIPKVPLPGSDPAFGKQGPLLRLWND